jgi:quercetin dioxygenase-like cupin family protein
MRHIPAEEMGWESAPEDNFTGKVWFGPMIEAARPEELNVLGVMFEPGARTDWHLHPGGQTLYIVSGAGYVVNEAGDVSQIGPGDVVSSPPGEVHWHGAGPGSFMVHLSLTTGGPTEWLSRPVSDDEYPGS